MKILKLLLLFPALFFYSCIDGPNNIELQSINGAVYDERGAPLPSLFVSTNNLSMFRTNYDGKFILDNVTIPYNVFISTGSNFFTSYYSIKNKNPNLITILGHSPKWHHLLIVHFPPLKPGRYLILKFISDKYHEQDEYFFYHNETFALIDVSGLHDELITAGKLIYLEGNGGSYGISTYEKYGIKDFTFQPYETNITFFPEDISYNPEEREMEIYSPDNGELNHFYTEAYLNFENIYDDVLIDMGAYSNYSYFTVPVLPNIKYDIKILDEAEGNNWERSTKWIHLQPGENATITHDPCPSIISPANNSIGITDTSTFAVLDNAGPGIYKYSFGILDSTGYSFAYDIYTDRKTFRFKDLAGTEFKVPPNLKFRWMVYKIPNYNSIDELVSTPYVLDSRYNALQNTKEFRFTAAP